MSIAKSRNLLAVLALITLVPLSARGDEDIQWRKRFKQARHNMLGFSIAVNGYYNAMLFQGQADDAEKKRLIDGSIASRQALNSIEACPEEYKEARETCNEIYENLRKMELMAENRQVAFSQLEEQKELKKKVDDLMDTLEELLKLK